MTCETVRPLLSEFQDDGLEAATSWQIQTHLAECEGCARISRELSSVCQMLHVLPTRQPSTNFEASLAQRLALTRRPQSKPTWQTHLRQAFPSPRFRPALALCAALTAAGVIFFAPISPVRTPDTPRTAPAVDHAFVADCVAQHRRDAAGEPLADMAAQNLAGRLDGAAPLPPAQGADVGLF